MSTDKRPFSMEHVMNATVKRVVDDIEYSIKKTAERLPQFANDTAKSTEIFTTITYLSTFLKQVKEFQAIDKNVVLNKLQG